MNLGDVKNKIGSVVGNAKEQHVAREEKAESDIEADAAVAGSREGEHGSGEYVGRTNPQFDAEDQMSGAEARTEAKRQAENES